MTVQRSQKKGNSLDSKEITDDRHLTWQYRDQKTETSPDSTEITDDRHFTQQYRDYRRQYREDRQLIVQRLQVTDTPSDSGNHRGQTPHLTVKISQNCTWQYRDYRRLTPHLTVQGLQRTDIAPDRTDITGWHLTWQYRDYIGQTPHLTVQGLQRTDTGQILWIDWHLTWQYRDYRRQTPHLTWQSLQTPHLTVQGLQMTDTSPNKTVITDRHLTWQYKDYRGQTPHLTAITDRHFIWQYRDNRGQTPHLTGQSLQKETSQVWQYKDYRGQTPHLKGQVLQTNASPDSATCVLQGLGSKLLSDTHQWNTINFDNLIINLNSWEQRNIQILTEFANALTCSSFKQVLLNTVTSNNSCMTITLDILL